MNHLGRGRFQAFSAGSQPVGVVHPMALEMLAELRISTDGFRSKSWAEFARPDSPALDFVFTVCDKVAASSVRCGRDSRGVPDPAALWGSGDEKRQHFRDAGVTLQRRIALSLPLEGLDSMSIQREVRDIGTS